MDAVDKYELLNEVKVLWNAEADDHQFNHGIYVRPWPGNANLGARTGGVATQAGQVAVSTNSPHSLIPHEFGHNLDSNHPAGCGAENIDKDYPSICNPNALAAMAGFLTRLLRLVTLSFSAPVLGPHCGVAHYI